MLFSVPVIAAVCGIWVELDRNSGGALAQAVRPYLAAALDYLANAFSSPAEFTPEALDASLQDHQGDIEQGLEPLVDALIAENGGAPSQPVLPPITLNVDQPRGGETVRRLSLVSAVVVSPVDMDVCPEPSDQVPSSSAQAVKYVEFEYSQDRVNWHPLPTPDSATNRDWYGCNGWALRFDTEAAGVLSDQSVWVRARAVDMQDNPWAWDESAQFAVDNTPSPNQAPVLSAPQLYPADSGSEDTLFTFSVRYTDPNDDPPDYVRLRLNGMEVDLAPSKPSDTNYVDGAGYEWASLFSPGTYYYYYESSDGTSSVQTGFGGGLMLIVTPRPAGAVSVTANPASIPLDGVSTSTIRVVVKDAHGTPLPGQLVKFTANRGFTFSPGTATTNSSGVATTQFRPDESGDTVVTAMVDSLTARTTVNAYGTSSAYSIQLSAQNVTSTDTEKVYEIRAYVNYSSNGQPAEGKTITLYTNSGTFQNGQQSISAAIEGGEMDPFDPNTPVYLTVTSNGDVTITGVVEVSSSTLTFEVVLGGPIIVYPGTTLDGTGAYERDHELAWSPDGQYLVTVVSGGAQVWRVSNWTQVALLSCQQGNPPRTFEFSPAGNYLAIAEQNHWFSVFSLPGYSLAGCRDLDPSYNDSVSWSDDEEKLAIIHSPNEIRVYNRDGNYLRSLSVPLSTSHGTESLFSLDWDGNRLAAGGETGIAYMWDTDTWQRVWADGYDLCFRSLESVEWSGDGVYVAFVGDGMECGGDNNVAFFTRDGTLTARLNLGHDALYSVDWAPDQYQLVVNDDETQVKIIDMSGNELADLQNGGHYSVGWSSTDLVAVAGDDNRVQVYAPYDHTLPLISIDAPENNRSTRDSSVVVSGRTSDRSGITSATIDVNGGSALPITIGDDGTFSAAAALANGANVISVRATDTADNSASSSVSIERLQDQEGPVISNAFVSPDQGEVGALFTLAVSVQDDWSGVDAESIVAEVQHPDEFGIQTVQLYDDGVRGGDATPDDGLFTGVWDSSWSSDGPHSVDVGASDVEGNVREVDNALTMRVYDQPVIISVATVPENPTSSDSVIVAAQLRDSSGIASATVFYSRDKGKTWHPLPMLFDAAISDHTAEIPPGVGWVDYRVEATDPACHSTVSDLLAYFAVPDPAVYRFERFFPVVLAGY